MNFILHSNHVFFRYKFVKHRIIFSYFVCVCWSFNKVYCISILYNVHILENLSRGRRVYRAASFSSSKILFFISIPSVQLNVVISNNVTRTRGNRPVPANFPMRCCNSVARNDNRERIAATSICNSPYCPRIADSISDLVKRFLIYLYLQLG